MSDVQIKHIRLPVFIIGLVILAVAILVMMKQTFNREVPSVEPAAESSTRDIFKLTSPVFDNSGAIPAIYTCKSDNISPPLAIQNVPDNTKELALIMHDPNAVDKDWVHWLVWKIPVTTSLISEHQVPADSIEGTTDFGKPGYGGPCPPAGTGTHNYTFDLYALNDTIDLDATATRDTLIAAMNGKVVAKAQLVGRVTAAQ
jgi:hypothetical protein